MSLQFGPPLDAFTTPSPCGQLLDIDSNKIHDKYNTVIFLITTHPHNQNHVFNPLKMKLEILSLRNSLS